LTYAKKEIQKGQPELESNLNKKVLPRVFFFFCGQSEDVVEGVSYTYLPPSRQGGRGAGRGLRR
jgi:hypothetical protein